MSATSRELFGLTLLNNRHKDIRALRREHGYPTHHGNKVWRSSLLLMDYLQEFPIPKKARVLEVGCGWAVASLYCAKHFKARVTGLDLDASVLPFAEHHAKVNGVAINTVCQSYEKVTAKMLGEFDVLIGADICFWDELSGKLYNLVRRAHRAGVRSIITDPGRPPFTQMALKAEEKLEGVIEPWFVPHPHNSRGYVLDVPGQ